MSKSKGRLVILSGPSCVVKSQLVKAVVNSSHNGPAAFKAWSSMIRAAQDPESSMGGTIIFGRAAKSRHSGENHVTTTEQSL